VKRLVVLGSTGSVGRQVLDVVRQNPDNFTILGLSNGNNSKLLSKQIQEFSPKYVNTLGDLDEKSSNVTSVELNKLVTLPDVDLIVHAMSGSHGLMPVLIALEHGKDIALANKEPIVMAGEIIVNLAEKSGGRILPVDSEPSAIWQCIEGEDTEPNRLFITASGGAFRDKNWKDLSSVEPKDALAHPTWQMGKKITIDSATMMNKAFEVIESRWLFDIPYDRIEVVIHRQSVIHSMVEFVDGSIKAQMSNPDMRYPIQYAMSYPNRIKNTYMERFQPKNFKKLTLEEYVYGTYPCFDLAIEYAKKGGTYTSVLIGASEAAVDLFLDGKIGFTEIYDFVKYALDNHQPISHPNLQEILYALEYGKKAVYRSKKDTTQINML